MGKLDQIVSDINKKYKDQVIQKGTERLYIEKIPFSSPRANYATYGGIPMGKATEFFGPESGGKTTSALDIVGQAQKKAKKDFNDQLEAYTDEIEELEAKNNKTDQKKIKQLQTDYDNLLERGEKKVIYLDTENTLDEEWANLNGVNTEEMYLIRPEDQTAEEILQMMIDLVDSGEVILIVLDSLPMLVGQQVYEETLEKKSYGGIASAVTDFSKRISSRLSKNRTAMIIINQSRQDLMNPYNKYNTPGGKALKHLFGLRLYFRRGKFLNEKNEELPNNAENPQGNMVNFDIVKSKVSKPDRKIGQYTLSYFQGIDVTSDTVFLAIIHDLIIQQGAWFTFIDKETGEIMNHNGKDLKFQGKANLLQYLRTEQELFNELYEAVNEKAKD